LTAASSQQYQTRSNDVAGLVFIGLPVGSMSGGNVAPEIANYKGQIEAVQQAMIRKNCSARWATAIDQFRKPPSAPALIRIAITPAAFEAIAATLPLGSVGFEPQTNAKGERLIWLEAAVVNRLAAMRGPGEDYSDVITRLAQGDARRGMKNAHWALPAIWPSPLIGRWPNATR
jgi:hypothetical protein